jgi:hypothetical protein
MGPQWGPDTKTDWPTDGRSQNNLNLVLLKTYYYKNYSTNSYKVLQYNIILWKKWNVHSLHS